MASELNAEALGILKAIQTGDSEQVGKLLSESTGNRTGILEWSLGAYSEANMEWQRNPMWTDTWGHKLLHWATEELKAESDYDRTKSSPAIVRSLVEYGFDPNCPGTDNCTALQLIAKINSPEAEEISQYLIKKGAGVNIQTPP
ncbi:hypothetical protein MKZ38_001485 [Zalerion maritima]|uniref:Ankyrin repeat domain-containing protein n=1 Tax=Zalerion maritima TaxID=339359 RepID=A0AAD5WX13_9PEZI|nr:hypothetical protein MKZ38_001485 [Zalerion maritima]